MIRDIKAIFEQKGPPVLTRIVADALITIGVIVTAMLSGGLGGLATTLVAEIFKTSKQENNLKYREYSKDTLLFYQEVVVSYFDFMVK